MTRRSFLSGTTAATLLSLVGHAPARGQRADPAGAGPSPANPPRFTPLRRNVGHFTARGGTIGWLASPEALAVVDTQFPETAEACIAGLPGRADRTMDVVINTHHHADHTSGNGVFRAVARTIVAQEGVPELQRAAARRWNNEATQVYADQLFAERWRLDVGDDTISARYFGAAHTRADIAVCFEKANVIHLGDLVFNRIYPVIDRAGGASIRHWISVLETLSRDYPADALYIFGHGKAEFGVTGHRADVLAFRDYLGALLEHVSAQIQSGRSRDEVLSLENLPGFPDFHAAPGPASRMTANLTAAYEELTGASG